MLLRGVYNDVLLERFLLYYNYILINLIIIKLKCILMYYYNLKLHYYHFELIKQNKNLINYVLYFLPKCIYMPYWSNNFKYRPRENRINFLTYTRVSL